MSVPAGLMMSQFQGMQPNGLMSGAPNSIQGLLSAPGATLNPQTPGIGGNPGAWSQLAYRMAGSPLQGPYPSVATPPTTPGSTVGSSASTGAGALGVLGLLAKNPGLVKNLGSAVNGLLGTDLGSPAWEAGLDKGTSSYLSSQYPVTPVTAPVTQPDQNLYSGAQNANADTAASELGSYTASGGLAGYLAAQAAAPAAPAAAVGIYDAANGGLLAGTQLGADAAGGVAGSAAAPAAADAAGSAASGAAGGIGAGTLAAGAGAAAVAALPFLAEFGVIGDDTLPSGAAFIQSAKGLLGTPGSYFTQQQWNQLNQMYGQLGESGFWPWFQQQYPGWGNAASRPNDRPMVKPP